MKYFLILLVAALAAVEFAFHMMQDHTHHDSAQSATHDKAQRARDLLQQHLQGHH
jgi:hypothetical protein